MKVLKLFVVAFFASLVITSLSLTRIVRSQTGPTEAPAAFDNQTNGFEPQGSPVQPNTTPTPNTFETDKFLFSKVEEIADGLGPVYNAQSCRECHQNPVTGGISQISELRAGHSRPDGTFVDAPGGSLINDRAIDPLIQERVPDGPRLVCSMNGSDIFFMGFDGGQYGEMVNDPTGVNDPAFSSDGTKVVFSLAGSNGIKQIFVMNVDGTNRTQLTTDPSGAINPAWSPDNTTIAFTSSRSGGSQIWAMNTDGTNQRNLTNDGVGGNGFAAWSPDSQHIAFQRLRNNAQTDIWVMNADGSGQTNLTNTPATSFFFNGQPSWSPDGTMIAFTSTRDSGNYEIYKMNSDGSAQTRLTVNSAQDQFPAWSPDGSIIAFQSSRSGGLLRLWIMQTDGSNQTLLLKQSFNSYTSPHWSPDSGETIRTFRSSLNILGDGFVEATDDATLLAIQAAQPEGMRGTAISVPLLEASGQTRIGRFGWKDQQASLLSFASDAYLNEMGITNRFNLVENSSLGRSVAAFDTVPDNQPCNSDPTVNCGEDGSEDINAFARFMRSTKAPSRDRNLVPTDSTDPGSQLFDTLSCSVCHTRSITTTSDPSTTLNGGTFTVGSALANKTFHPFGDFLLHDIGTGDGIAQAGGETTKNMVRTAPLWGVRTRTRLMHDAAGSSSAPTNNGTQSFTFNEAILRHAGQATSSRNAYQALTLVQKAQLIKFLKSL
jgi:CxxC motif-containing protein (DUF1111 family)